MSRTIILQNTMILSLECLKEIRERLSAVNKDLDIILLPPEIRPLIYLDDDRVISFVEEGERNDRA